MEPSFEVIVFVVGDFGIGESTGSVAAGDKLSLISRRVNEIGEMSAVKFSEFISSISFDFETAMFPVDDFSVILATLGVDSLNFMLRRMFSDMDHELLTDISISEFVFAASESDPNESGLSLPSK